MEKKKKLGCVNGILLTFPISTFSFPLSALYFPLSAFPFGPQAVPSTVFCSSLNSGQAAARG
jgi:hypothetical protein